MRKPSELERRATERLRAVVADTIAEAGGNKRNASKRLGIDNSIPSKLNDPKRGASLDTISRVCEATGLDWRYFFAEDLGDRPTWQQWVGAREATAPAEASEAWLRFDLGAEPYGLSAEQKGWMQRAPFRGVPPNQEDYTRLAEVLARMPVVRPGFSTGTPIAAKPPARKRERG